MEPVEPRLQKKKTKLAEENLRIQELMEDIAAKNSTQDQFSNASPKKANRNNFLAVNQKDSSEFPIHRPSGPVTSIRPRLSNKY